jgi:RNA-directed DNA polymerase
MTAVIAAGAASHEVMSWPAIDWQKAYHNVRRLQARIVKARQAGRWGKVKALQHLLTHAFSGRVMAVKRVTDNPGKRTPGIDGELWDTPEKKAQAVNTLRHYGYRPLPLRRVHIPKSNGKKRPLGILTMKDRAMQALHLLALDPIAECHADPNSYGFRTERRTADAIEQCHTVLSNRAGARFVLEGDIKSCFDKISHDWLLANIPMDKRLLGQWLKAGFIEKAVFNTTDEGVVQGGPISPVLANWTLDGLEKKLREKYPKASAQSYRAKANYCRWADDFIITGSSKELLEREVKPLVEAFLQERGLELSPEKTRITPLENGFDFLGQNVRKYNDGKIIIKPSTSNVKAFLAKVRQVIKGNAQAKAGNLIVQLNPLMRGWANYHRHICSKHTFSTVDHAIFRSLWRWARRRHPNKPRRWVKEKYFHHTGQRHWVFCGEAVGWDGKLKSVHLFHAADVAIKRHIKIKGEANPYDPAWEMYFEHRLGVRMADDLKGRRQLLHLWQEQNGLCPVCRQKITKLTGWHNHHLVWRSHGGSNSAKNRVLLHPECHRQVHNLDLEVVKPRPETDV